MACNLYIFISVFYWCILMLMYFWHYFTIKRSVAGPDSGRLINPAYYYYYYNIYITMFLAVVFSYIFWIPLLSKISLKPNFSVNYVFRNKNQMQLKTAHTLELYCSNNIKAICNITLQIGSKSGQQHLKEKCTFKILSWVKVLTLSVA